MSLKEIFDQLSLWNFNYYLKSDNFCLNFILYLQVYGSGSRKLLNKDPIRIQIQIQIRIHNTGYS